MVKIIDTTIPLKERSIENNRVSTVARHKEYVLCDVRTRDTNPPVLSFVRASGMDVTLIFKHSEM